MSRPQGLPSQPVHGRKRLKDRARPTNNHLPRAPRAGSLAAQLEDAKRQVDEAIKARKEAGTLRARQGPDPREVYRREAEAAKARLRARDAERWAEIDRAWQRQKDADALARKGGRPPNITIGKRNRDLLRRASDRT